MPPRTRLSDGPVPKHVQLREALAGRVRTLGPDDAIPSERELMTAYDVSRATVRRAIEGLIADGVLHRIQGKGTFVTRSTRLVGISLEELPGEVAGDLRLEAGVPAWLVQRVRLADDEPMAFERAWHPADLLPGLDQHDLTGSLYDVFASEYGVVVTSGEQTVRAESADADQARLLGTAKRAPLLVQERVTYAGDRVIELSTSWYRADRYRIHMAITPRGAREN